MKVLISGSTGLVGSALVEALQTDGHEVVRLVRREPEQPREATVGWDPAAGAIDSETLAATGRLDAVVHLAGESIAGGRWTAARKARIRDSRVDGTGLLARSLAELADPPRVLVSASAIGWYGDRGEEWMDESQPPGSSFLCGVCRDWEAAAEPARTAGIRVVHPRIGVVLSSRGGALQKMLLPFKLGLGGRVGSGAQHWSWITIDDVVAAIRHAIANDNVEGPVNTVAPTPATNAEFTTALGRVLGRPTILPMPAFAARLLLGEMADELLLSSTRVRPGVLDDTGFAFAYPNLEKALRHVLKSPAGRETTVPVP